MSFGHAAPSLDFYPDEIPPLTFLYDKQVAA
jgi:hypothetical protein